MVLVSESLVVSLFSSLQTIVLQKNKYNSIRQFFSFVFFLFFTSAAALCLLPQAVVLRCDFTNNKNPGGYGGALGILFWVCDY